MKLYNNEIPSNPRRIRIFLAEKGVEIPTQNVDIFKGEQFTPEFKKKSPLWDIPLLELDDGTCISQVGAICRYLEDQYPEPPLYGTTQVDKAQIEMWDHIAFINGMQAIAEVARNGMEVFAGRAVLGTQSYEQIPELAVRGQQRCVQFMEEMSERLTANSYIAGESYSVADITAFVAIDLAVANGIPIPEACERLASWHAELSARPSAQA